MRKTSLALIALCLLLTACDASDPENVFEATQPQETDAAQETTPPVTEPITTAEEGYYQYGNMQKGDPAGNYIVYGDEVLFTAIPDGQFLLYSYDMSTGEVSLLCKDATCDHGLGASNCLSGYVYGNLEQYNGKFYAVNRNDQIVELKDGRFEKVVDGSVSGFWHANGNLYVKTADHSLLVYENGSDTPRVLLDEYSELWNTGFGQYLYSGFGQGICRVDLSAEDPQVEVLVKDSRGRTDGQYIYYIDLNDYKLYRCRMDGSGTELLVDQPVHSGSLNFDDEYLYFRLFKNVDEMFGEGTNVLYRMSKAEPTQMEQIAELPEPIEAVYTVPGYNLLFVETIDLGETVEGFHPNAVRYLYTMNTDGGNMTKLELPDY